MLYVIVGTGQVVREKATSIIAKMGTPSAVLYQEHADQLRFLVDANSLFGDTTVVSCVQLGTLSDSKEILVTQLPKMKESRAVFVVDEPFADIHLVNKLQKVADQFFDAREEKKKDTKVFMLCDLFVQKDKKSAWVLLRELLDSGEAEAIQGALWWKFQTEWQKVLDGKRSLFTKEECEYVGKRLMEAPIKAHRGELDLKVELERIILSL